MKLGYFMAGIGLLALQGVQAQEPTYIPADPPAVQLPAETDAAVRAATKKIHVKKIVLIGDSTTQVGSGWGGAFCANHVTSFTACVNLGRGGRSSFSYRAEGSWDVALSEMKTPGFDKIYVLIQFGHNDQPGKPGRTTDLYAEFPANLARYVTETRAAGAIPVLVTPLTRRSFKDGALQDQLKPWADAARKVAKDMNAPLVDLHAMSVAAVQKMGARAAVDLAETMPAADVLAAAEKGTTIAPTRLDGPATPMPTQAAQTSTEVVEGPQAHPLVVFDYTHLGEKGAAFFSAQVAQGLAAAVPDLRKDLIP